MSVAILLLIMDITPRISTTYFPHMNITRKIIMRKQNIVVTQSAFHMFKDPQTPYANGSQKKELT